MKKMIIFLVVMTLAYAPFSFAMQAKQASYIGEACLTCIG